MKPARLQHQGAWQSGIAVLDNGSERHLRIAWRPVAFVTLGAVAALWAIALSLAQYRAARVLTDVRAASNSPPPRVFGPYGERNADVADITRRLLVSVSPSQMRRLVGSGGPGALAPRPLAYRAMTRPQQALARAVVERVFTARAGARPPEGLTLRLWLKDGQWMYRYDCEDPPLGAFAVGLVGQGVREEGAP